MISIPKGTKDVLPKDSPKWQYLEDEARKQCALYGAHEIRTPIFEHTELFLRGVGETTDVVGKEMYTFSDKSGRSITLKPEGTASVARSFIENSLEGEGLPQKLFYISPIFRYENPQAGRFRQHHQFGAEFFGAGSPAMDAEVISLAHSFLQKLGLKSLALNLNSIGCNQCRPRFNETLKVFLKEREGELCETCRDRLVRNPLRILDCKSPKCQNILLSAPKTTDCTCDECNAHASELYAILDSFGINYSINPHIVRGLDYYTKTVFEFVTTDLGAQGTVCGGGRYDNLLKNLGGKDIPAVGFGMGIERLLMLLEANNTGIDAAATLDFFVSATDDTASNTEIDAELLPLLSACNARSAAMHIVRMLRQSGFSADYDFLSRSLKSQAKAADRLAAKYLITIGGNELKTGQAVQKRMSDGQQKQISLIQILKGDFKHFEE